MEQHVEQGTRKFDLKIKVIAFLLIIIAALAVALFLNMRTTQNLQDHYMQGIHQLDTLEREKSRCSELLTQERGDFAEYEYCREFLRKFDQR